MQSANQQPLEGVRVITLAQQLPGPFAASILADLGADVVFVEHPERPDPTRRLGAYFEAMARNQRAIALDLKRADQVEALHALVRDADVFIEGFRPGVASRLGVGPEELRSINPDLIYASISSYGQTGPMGSQSGHDISVQARAGLLAAYELGALPLADLAGAMYAAVGILGSLVGRCRSGGGATLDVAMLDSLLAWRGASLLATATDREPAPYPPLDPGYGLYESADGLVALGIAGEDHHWDVLCEVLGLDDLVGVPTSERELSADRVRARLQTAIAAAPTAVREHLESRGIVVAQALGDREVLADPQVIHRNILVSVESDPSVLAVRQPILVNGGWYPIRRPTPRVGEHTDEILAEIGSGRPVPGVEVRPQQ